MNILYLIAMYGSQHLGNLIHREIGHRFQEQGHTFRVFALSSWNERRHQPAETVEEDITVHRAVTAGRTAPNVVNAAARPWLHYDRFGMGWWTLQRYLADHPETDLILAEGAYPFGAMAALARRGSRPRLGITAAGGDFIDDRANRYGYGRFRSARYLMRYAFDRAAFVRVTTPLVRSRVLALGASPEKIALIPRNIAAYCFPPSEISLSEFRCASRAHIAARYGLGDAPLIISVGRLLPIKGFDTLIRSLGILNQSVPHAKLLIVGPNRPDPVLGDYQAHLTGLAAQLGMADSVIFTGIVPHHDMREHLAAADVIAVPSILEGMNKIAVEGAAVGTPSVVTRTAGIADLLMEAGLDEIVEPNSPDQLAAHLIAILQDPVRRAALGERGIGWAKQFSSPVVAAQLIELCNRTLH
jgi:glycosyltransferase involved in cell wall biosynthesis